MIYRVGQRYSLRLSKRREFVLDYIGADRDGTLNFSARPQAGTQRVRPEEILEAHEVDRSVKIKI